MEKIKNKFHIITPTKNCSSDLEILINSLLCQTYNSWNLILVDGNSRNIELQKIKSLASIDNRISLKKQDFNRFKGIYGGMNIGINNVNLNSDWNNWLIFIGADDLLIENNTLEKLDEKINEYSKYKIYDLITTKSKYYKNTKFIRKSEFFGKKNIFSRMNFEKMLFYGYIPCHQSTIFNSKIFSPNLRYNHSLKIAADLYLFLELTKYKISVLNLNMYTVSISCGGISSKKHLKRTIEVIKAYKSKFGYKLLIPFILRYIKKLMGFLKK